MTRLLCGICGKPAADERFHSWRGEYILGLPGTTIAIKAEAEAEDGMYFEFCLDCLKQAIDEELKGRCET